MGLLRMGLFLPLGPNFITDGGPLLYLGPVITLAPSTNSQIPIYTTNDKASRT